MGLFDDLKAMFRREAQDAREWIDESVDGANASLNRAERRISDDPAERLQATLDDIDDSDATFDAVRDRAEGRTVRPDAVAEVEPDGAPIFTPHSRETDEDSAADLSALPGMAMARLWISPTENSMQGFHTLWLDEKLGSVVGEDWFEGSFVAAVESLPEVEEVIHEDREVLHLRGADLTAARARVLVAAIVAPRIGEDWQDRLP